MGWRSLQIWVVLVLSDHVPDALEDDPGVLLDGGPHHWPAFPGQSCFITAVTPWLSAAGFTSSLLVKESVTAEAVAGL